jgi:hypothetical protein
MFLLLLYCGFFKTNKESGYSIATNGVKKIPFPLTKTREHYVLPELRARFIHLCAVLPIEITRRVFTDEKFFCILYNDHWSRTYILDYDK